AGAWSAAARATTAHRRGHWPPLGAGPAPAVALLLRRSHDEGSWVGPGSDGITRVTAPHHGDASAPGDPRRPTAGGGPRRVTHARALPRAPMVMTGPSWLPAASSPGRPENASGRRALERDVLVALRAVRAEATDEVRVAPEADPCVRRHERRVRDGRLAHPDHLAGHVHQHRRRPAVGSEPGVGADDDVVLHVDPHRADRHARRVPAGLWVAEGERARRQRPRAAVEHLQPPVDARASGPSRCPGPTSTSLVPQVIGGSPQAGETIGSVGTPGPGRTTEPGPAGRGLGQAWEMRGPLPRSTQSPGPRARRGTWLLLRGPRGPVGHGDCSPEAQTAAGLVHPDARADVAVVVQPEIARREEGRRRTIADGQGRGGGRRRRRRGWCAVVAVVVEVVVVGGAQP